MITNETLKTQLKNTLEKTNFKIGKKFEGKVRDSYILDEKRLIETEIKVRNEQAPTDVNLDASAPILLPELQNILPQLQNQLPQIESQFSTIEPQFTAVEPQKLPIKELAIIGAILLLI